MKDHRTLPDNHMNTGISFKDLLEGKQFKGVRKLLARKKGNYAFVARHLD